MEKVANLPIPVMDTLAGFTVAEILIVLGQTRAMVGPTAGNRYVTGVAIEWVTSLSLSPQTGKHLWRQLGDMVEQYERKFGTIQHDPAAAPPTGASVTPLRLVPEEAPPAQSLPAEPPAGVEPPPPAA